MAVALQRRGELGDASIEEAIRADVRTDGQHPLHLFGLDAEARTRRDAGRRASEPGRGEGLRTAARERLAPVGLRGGGGACRAVEVPEAEAARDQWLEPSRRTPKRDRLLAPVLRGESLESDGGEELVDGTAVAGVG